MSKEKKIKNPLLDNSEEVVEKKVEVSTDKPVEAKKTIAELADSDIRATKKILDAEEKIHFMVPLAEGEKPGAVQDCFINGYKFTVKKGVMVQVPKSIATILSEHYRVAMEAGQESRIDLSADKQDALA